MKPLLPFFALVVLATACNSHPKEEAATVNAAPATVTADTSGLSQFQAWKAQHELATAANYNAQAAPAKTTHTAAPVHHTTTNRSESTQPNSISSESANTAKAAEKRGWSKAAKGAAIGAGTGAVIGAVVNKKNRVAGGVIGGAAGAGVGYGVGRHIDKRDGRY